VSLRDITIPDYSGLFKARPLWRVLLFWASILHRKVDGMPGESRPADSRLSQTAIRVHHLLQKRDGIQLKCSFRFRRCRAMREALPLALSGIFAQGNWQYSTCNLCYRALTVQPGTAMTVKEMRPVRATAPAFSFST